MLLIGLENTYPYSLGDTLLSLIDDCIGVKRTLIYLLLETKAHHCDQLDFSVKSTTTRLDLSEKPNIGKPVDAGPGFL